MRPGSVSFRWRKSIMTLRWSQCASSVRRFRPFSTPSARMRPVRRSNGLVSGRHRLTTTRHLKRRDRQGGDAMPRPLSVAIVGAGMGGLATAAALRRGGLEVTVYEQDSKFAHHGASIQIGCNAMKVLRALGLEARMREHAFYPRSWNNRDWRSGDIKFDMIFGESAEEKFGAPYLLAHRGDLHTARASVVPADVVKLNHKLVGL